MYNLFFIFKIKFLVNPSSHSSLNESKKREKKEGNKKVHPTEILCAVVNRKMSTLIERPTRQLYLSFVIHTNGKEQ